jgi:hypothetical protein
VPSATTEDVGRGGHDWRVGLYENQIDQARREISRLRDRISSSSKTVATERERSATEKAKAARATNASMRSMYERNAAAAEAKANKAEHDRARAEADLAGKEKKLFEAQASLDKERVRADNRRLADLERRMRERSTVRSNVPRTAPVPAPTATAWDFFISHASPDKEEIVAALAEGLTSKGARVWYDDFELRVGDSLRQRIDDGLARSRFGIVVLTHSYLAGRAWTENELNGLFASNKRILPVWHNVSRDEVAAYSPILADRVALLTAVQSLDSITDDLLALIRDP